TSDKVETDNTNFATVKADQTCEEVLIPRENAFRQLNWQVTLEKGAVYNPQERVGIYAKEVDCKYGVQIHGDVFGRDSVRIEHGGAAHSESEEGTLGARVLGSVTSEKQIEVVEPTSRMDDWAERPVTVYGDVIGDTVAFEAPTVVYGCVSAESSVRVNAPTVVLGDLRSEGIVEATDLFAYSINATGDVTLGGGVITATPTVWAREGDLTIAEPVGILTPDLFEHVRSGNDVDAVGPWVFDVEAIRAANALYPVDVMDEGDGQVASRSWRTVGEPDSSYYEDVRDLLGDMFDRTRRDPPDVEELRYSGLASVGEGGGTSIEGDLVIGTQEKSIEETDVTEIDQSTTTVDRSTEVHDESTTVEDSVVNRSDVGDAEETGGE
ncbi:MAG: hypothetical protein ABEI99_07665, partial [Halobaculum sp.]